MLVVDLLDVLVYQLPARTLPYIRAWAEKYRAAVWLAIESTPREFAFEKDQDNVRKAVAEYNVTYPVALDIDYRIWKGFNNSYWPAGLY